MSKFSAGKHAKAMCDRCGVEYKYTLLQLEWTGYKVCPECFDEKSALEFPTNVPVDAEALMNPRPDTDVEASEGKVSAKDTSTGDTPIGTMFRGFEPVSAVGSVTVTIS